MTAGPVLSRRSILRSGNRPRAQCGYLFTGATVRVGPGSGRGAWRDARLRLPTGSGVALLWSAVLPGIAGGAWLKRGLPGSK